MNLLLEASEILGFFLSDAFSKHHLVKRDFEKVIEGGEPFECRVKASCFKVFTFHRDAGFLVTLMRDVVGF